MNENENHSNHEEQAAVAAFSATVDQMIAFTGEQARLAHATYESLVEAGFSPNQAIILTAHKLGWTSG